LERAENVGNGEAMNKVSLITLCIGIVGLIAINWGGPGTMLTLVSLCCIAVGLVGALIFPFEMATRDFRLAGFKIIAFQIFALAFCRFLWVACTS
jgi:hypothetical protein